MCSSNEQKAKKLILFRNFATFFQTVKSIMQLIDQIRVQDSWNGEARRSGAVRPTFFVFRFTAPNRFKKVFEQ